jgi:hypothetical protein
MAGVGDTTFFNEVQRFADTHGAPAPARAAVAFLKGIATWDYRAASDAADVLLELAAKGDFWMDPDILRDGAVMARLRIGDLAGAREVFRRTAVWATRDVSDLRTQLLYAYVTDGGSRPLALAAGAGR